MCRQHGHFEITVFRHLLYFAAQFSDFANDPFCSYDKQTDVRAGGRNSDIFSLGSRTSLHTLRTRSFIFFFFIETKKKKTAACPQNLKTGPQNIASVEIPKIPKRPCWRRRVRSVVSARARVPVRALFVRLVHVSAGPPWTRSRPRPIRQGVGARGRPWTRDERRGSDVV